jgi:CBS domain-containing protein
MSELQRTMEAKGRYQPSKTVEALFTTAVIKIKANAERAVARSKAVPEMEVASTEDSVEAKTEEFADEQKAETQVDGEVMIEANETETESVEKTDAGESKSQAEPVSEKETKEASESEEEQESEVAENKSEDVDKTFESEAEKEDEISAESQDLATGEVSESNQQMDDSDSNHPGEQLLASTDLCAKDVMIKEIAWASPEESVQQAITKMQNSNSSYLMVGKENALEGIVSNSNIMGALSPYLRPEFAKWRRQLDDATLKIKIKWIMSRPVNTVKLETSFAEIIENMCRFGKRAFPVVDEQDKVLGLVTVFDIFRVLSNSTDVSTMDEVSETHSFAQFDLGIDKEVKDAK